VILVGTPVWIEHLRLASAILSELLDDGEVLVHPFVLGELALGNLRRRDEILRELQNLPQANGASHREALQLVDREALLGRGIGYVDAHLLAAARLTGGTKLWTTIGGCERSRLAATLSDSPESPASRQAWLTLLAARPCADLLRIGLAVPVERAAPIL
jgi:predicted nucleic acid-binding protein